MAAFSLANTESAPCLPFHLPTKSDWDLVNIHFLEDALSFSRHGMSAMPLQQTRAVAVSFAQVTIMESVFLVV